MKLRRLLPILTLSGVTSILTPAITSCNSGGGGSTPSYVETIVVGGEASDWKATNEIYFEMSGKQLFANTLYTVQLDWTGREDAPINYNEMDFRIENDKGHSIEFSTNRSVHIGKDLDEVSLAEFRSKDGFCYFTGDDEYQLLSHLMVSFESQVDVAIKFQPKTDVVIENIKLSFSYDTLKLN